MSWDILHQQHQRNCLQTFNWSPRLSRLCLAISVRICECVGIYFLFLLARSTCSIICVNKCSECSSVLRHHRHYWKSTSLTLLCLETLPCCHLQMQQTLRKFSGSGLEGLLNRLILPMPKYWKEIPWPSFILKLCPASSPLPPSNPCSHLERRRSLCSLSPVSLWSQVLFHTKQFTKVLSQK